ncbi:hypothetical protein H311_03847 [Anncaliia algerae PRA109]|nr:hypothetical protein H311_03847 [Anncaliia algerae PRA109]
MKDRNIWQTLGGDKNFCSFKMKTKWEPICRNKYNVTGICEEYSCPLSNSYYATVREEHETLFLYVKTPEKCHEPINMYEKIELSKDYNLALQQIDERLSNFDPFLLHKCKQRLTKLTQYLERKETIREKITITPVFKSRNRLERKRALKALKKINFEKNVEQELFERLKEGILGKEMQEQYKRKKAYVFEESDENELIKKKEKTKQILDW